MISRPTAFLIAMLTCAAMAQVSNADDKNGAEEQVTHHNMKHSMNDERISLGLSPQMKQHQLLNMRSHLEAVQAIIGLIAEGEFEKASNTAHSTLGLTEEMKMMCNSFENKNFRDLGFAFHESGDALGDALQAHDTDAALRALQATLGYCVQCHAAFRQ